MSNLWMYTISHVRPAIHLAWHNFNIGHYSKTFIPNCYTSAMLVDTIGFYHYIPLPLTLILARGCKVSAKQDLLASFSRTLFN